VNISILRKIGLTKGESKVYLALLGLGQTTTGPIVKKAGVTTSKSYKILARLEEKGLASHIYKNKIKHFKAASPTKVLDLINKDFEEIKEKKEEVQELIPRLLEYQKKIQQEHEAEIYFGIEGLRTLFNEQTRRLKKGESHYVIGITSKQDYGEPVSLFFEQLQYERDKKGISSNFLLGENARGTFNYIDNSKYSNTRYIPYASLVAINIYKDTTIIGIFTAGNPILFKIVSKNVADNFIEHFKILWKIAKK
jgi:sugar-specific transcriptional regulator TrmB